MKPNMSKSHPLRGIITEKLSTAASEILAAVERALAVYEAEASGLRQELERQRWHIELLQPRIKEEPSEDQRLFSLCDIGGRERSQEKVRQKRETKFENTQGLEILAYTGGLNQEPRIGMQGPEISSRLPPSAVLTDKIHVDRPHIRNLENYVDLKICILKDWTIQVVSDQVDEEYPVHELQCRSGLQEADFLNLLRSTFPQLASNTPFESFITDSTKRLQPLKVATFTPEHICSAAGSSTLYIRLKCPIEHEAGSQQQLVQVSDDDCEETDCYNEDASSIPLQTAAEAKSEPHQKKPAGDQIAEDEHILLRVRVLDDCVAVLSHPVLKKYKLQKLKCPCGMKEAEFLKLLRSTFPQLAADRPFEYFMTNLTKKLLPLKVESFTPEQICSAAGNSALYIRLKSVEEEVQASPKNPKQNKAVDRKDDESNSSSTTKQTTPKKENASQHQHWVRETDTHINLRIHLLEDSRIEAVTPEVLKKYQLHKLQCPRGMKESDFLRLLRSSLPKLATQTYFETFKSDQNRKLLPLNVTSFTPEMLCAAAGKSALYIRLKHPLNIRNRKEVTLQKTQDEAHPSSPHPATPNTEKENPNHNRVDDKDSHINLSICFLEDSHVDELLPQGPPPAPSSSRGSPELFFNKYPIHKLKCPRGLQETDFLDLLKSTFSQLADGRPLTVLALQGRKMMPLKVDRVIPEEIWRANSSVGSPFICLQLTKKPLQKEGPEPEHLPTTTHPSIPDTSIQSPSRTSGRPPNCELDNLLDLRICILDDPGIDVLSPLVLQKYPIVEFQCPGNLQKAEFLNLLRSTFPQLAGEAFDFLSSHGKNLENLGTEEFSRTLKLAGNSVLYVRLKEPPKVQASVKRSRPDVSDESGLCPSKRVKKLRKRAKVQSSKSRHGGEESEDDETEDSEDDDRQENAKSAKLSGSAKLLGLEPLTPEDKPRSEPVKSTDERSDATANIQIDDEETDDSEDENYYKNPQFSRLSFLQSHIPGHSSEQTTKTEPVKMMEEEHSSVKVSSQAEDEETEDSEDYNEHENLESSRLSSFHTKRSGGNTKESTMKEHMEKKEVTHNLKIQQVEVHDTEDRDDDDESTRLSSLQPQISGQVAKQNSSTEAVNVVEQKEDICTPNMTTNDLIEEVEIIDSEDDDGESSRTSSLQPQVSGEDSQQHNTSEASNMLEMKDLNHSGAKTNSKLRISMTTDKNLLTCKVCKVVHSSRRILARHAWRHVDDLRRLCGVCGKQFNSESTIRNHLETHQKTHKCKICDKSFLSRHGLSGHMDRHKGEERQHPHPTPAQE